MPPIQLSRRERSSLHKILERPREAGEIPADHAEKLINYDLARKRVLLLYITPLGQIELLRHGFGGGKPGAPLLRQAPASMRSQTPIAQILSGA